MLNRTVGSDTDAQSGKISTRLIGQRDSTCGSLLAFAFELSLLRVSVGRGVMPLAISVGSDRRAGSIALRLRVETPHSPFGNLLTPVAERFASNAPVEVFVIIEELLGIDHRIPVARVYFVTHIVDGRRETVGGSAVGDQAIAGDGSLLMAHAAEVEKAPLDAGRGKDIGTTVHRLEETDAETRTDNLGDKRSLAAQHLGNLGNQGRGSTHPIAGWRGIDMTEQQDPDAERETALFGHKPADAGIGTEPDIEGKEIERLHTGSSHIAATTLAEGEQL